MLIYIEQKNLLLIKIYKFNFRFLIKIITKT